jgi:alkylation response protein AidB-like acyl-CoA dehydrogenase
MTFKAPLDHMRFALESLGAFDQLARTGAFPEFSDELTEAVLAEAGRFAAEVLAPLDAVGDRQGARRVKGAVVTPKGFSEAYRQFAAGGWCGLAGPPAFGGQGLPRVLGTATQELWYAANVSFSLCHVLTKGAALALGAHGSDAQKRRYLHKLTSGAWTGTMNLTEPQAGSDLGPIKTRAEPAGEGRFHLKGTKIFITWGEHDMAENIVHLVLARLPDAPEGTRGLSLFVAPKRLVDEGGNLGTRNDIACTRLEEKLGIHASPTCVMSFGEKEGALAELVGEAHRGMGAMFTMMNDARLAIGVQGLGTGERAFQKALAYSEERRQGKLWERRHEASETVPIIAHPDVRRMLVTMKAHIEAMRLLTYANALALDLAQAAPTEKERRAAQLRADLLTPVSKAWCTDLGVDIASLAMQIFGGMGYVEETGVAQHFRDARIGSIYEGTNGIQAIDLVTRKLMLEGGAAVAAFLADIMDTTRALTEAKDEKLNFIGRGLADAHAILAPATTSLQDKLESAPADALAGATPYLKLFGTVAGAHFLGAAALDAARKQAELGASPFYAARILLAHFYAANMLPFSAGLAASAMAGMGDLAALDAQALSS